MVTLTGHRTRTHTTNRTRRTTTTKTFDFCPLSCLSCLSCESWSCVLGHVKFFLLFLLLPFQLFALSDVSVSASLDSTTLYEGWPVKGTLEITHYAEQAVDASSATINNQPLKIELLRNVRMSSNSSLEVSIYQFTLSPKNKGDFTLEPIHIQVGGKSFQTFPASYTVQGPISAPTVTGNPQGGTLKLQAYIDGPQELYPGQTTKLVYRYVYQGDIALSKETLPMLEPDGVQKVGRYQINNTTEGNSSVFEISQEVQALTPGDFSWGPSVVEGTIYVVDALGNKQFTTTKLVSEAPSVKLTVKPFPLEGQPASFNGAFGDFTFSATLTTPTKVTVGDPLILDLVVTGKTSNWDRVLLPEVCCQPGFGGFFKQSGLPPVGKIEGDSKHFQLTLSALSSAVKSIPPIQFSFFEPQSGKYKIVKSMPISISVAPVQEIAAQETEKAPSQKETPIDWLKVYQSADHSYVQEKEWNQELTKDISLTNHFSLDKEKLYEKIGDLFFNLQQYPWAVYYFNQAKRWNPRNQELEPKLENSFQKLHIEKKEASSPFKKVFFFHNYLSFFERKIILILCCLLIVAMISLSVWKPAFIVKNYVAALLLIGGIFFTSLLYSRYVEPLKGVIVQSSMVYREDSRQSVLVKAEPLFEGNTVEVLDVTKEGQWLKIRTPDGVLGYLPDEAIRLLN